MTTLKYSITINAPRKQVWDFMLGKETYPKWTMAFSPGSFFEGTWDEGAEIRFIDPNSKCVLLGKIDKSIAQEIVTIRHIAMDSGDGKMIPTEGEEALETYFFRDVDGGGTEVIVEMIMEFDQDCVAMMNDMWPKALEDLKKGLEA